MKARNVTWLVLASMTGPLWVDAQETGQAGAAYPMPMAIKKSEEITFRRESFTFVRIRYATAEPKRNTWAIDFPEADLNLMAQFQKVTGLKCGQNAMVLELTDPGLNQQPFIYIGKGGELRLSPGEVQSLRAYLLGGGFLMVDDFWGDAAWASLAAQIRQVFPDREPIELSLDHPLFRCFYEIRAKPQVPSIHVALRHYGTGVTWDRPDEKEVHYRGLIGDDSRLMAVFCHNTDLGDGWERAGFDEYYDREFSQKRAFPMGINIVVYALTQ